MSTMKSQFWQVKVYGEQCITRKVDTLALQHLPGGLGSSVLYRPVVISELQTGQPGPGMERIKA